MSAQRGSRQRRGAGVHALNGPAARRPGCIAACGWGEVPADGLTKTARGRRGAAKLESRAQGSFQRASVWTRKRAAAPAQGPSKAASAFASLAIPLLQHTSLNPAAAAPLAAAPAFLPDALFLSLPTPSSSPLADPLP
ncbi:hypothetical protein PSPO01_05410 [Paraphaeosphaeria sporulosa]